ncbi:MAG: hypothetical protein ABIP78_09490 [Pyrinomonadaceae bacterium]
MQNPTKGEPITPENPTNPPASEETRFFDYIGFPASTTLSVLISAVGLLMATFLGLAGVTIGPFTVPNIPQQAFEQVRWIAFPLFAFAL